MGVFYRKIRNDANISPTWVQMARRRQRNLMTHDVICDDRERYQTK